MQTNKAVNEQDIYGFLGLCMKAGKIIGGEERVIEAVRDGNAVIVLVAEDISDNSRKLYTNKCSFYKTQIVTFGNCEGLGKCTGKIKRAALAITDEGLAKAFSEKLLRFHQSYSQN